MQLNDAQKFQCPVCSRELHSFETDVLENHGSWCLVETACRHCGSSSMGLIVGRGKSKTCQAFKRYSKETHQHSNAEEDYFEGLLKKEQMWAESSP